MATHAVHLVRPFAQGGAAEIVAAPKVYAFDTGFVCFFRGWRDVRTDDLGVLWEHVVLNELHARHGRRPIHYWRAKHGPEVDFILTLRGAPPVAIECKWSADDLDPAGLKAFRRAYPEGRNVVITRDAREPFQKAFGDLVATFLPLERIDQAV